MSAPLSVPPGMVYAATRDGLTPANSAMAAATAEMFGAAPGNATAPTTDASADWTDTFETLTSEAAETHGGRGALPQPLENSLLTTRKNTYGGT